MLHWFAFKVKWVKMPHKFIVTTSERLRFLNQKLNQLFRLPSIFFSALNANWLHFCIISFSMPTIKTMWTKIIKTENKKNYWNCSTFNSIVRRFAFFSVSFNCRSHFSFSFGQFDRLRRDCRPKRYANMTIRFRICFGKRLYLFNGKRNICCST